MDAPDFTGYTGFMRRRLPLIAALLAAACSSGPRPLLIGDEDRRSYFHDSSDEEARAKAALDDIQRRVDRGDLPKINFEFDSDEITAESYATLDAVADLLLRSPRLKVFALAHTDSVGTEEYNLDLSERRAKSVKAYLVRQGVPPPSVRYKGFGFSRPIDDNSTDEGRARNRRVEFRVTYRDWGAVY